MRVKAGVSYLACTSHIIRKGRCPAYAARPYTIIARKTSPTAFAPLRHFPLYSRHPIQDKARHDHPPTGKVNSTSATTSTSCADHVADESVDLIYLDPPFNSNANYNVLFQEKSGQQSAAQITAFEDTWHWDEGSELAYRDVVTNASGKLPELLAGSCDLSSWARTT